MKISYTRDSLIRQSWTLTPIFLPHDIKIRDAYSPCQGSIIRRVSSSFTINGLRITGQYGESIRFHVKGYYLQQNAQVKNSWNNHTWNCIDFESYGSFCRRLWPSQQVRHTKFAYDHLPLGNRRYKQARIKDESLRLCPCCKKQVETSTHFLRCSAYPGFLLSLRAFDREIQWGDAHPAKYLIAGAVRQWSQSDDLYVPDLSPYPAHMQESIESAITSQNRIGWEQMI